MPRAEGQHIVDEAGVFDDVDEAQINDDLLTLQEETGIDIAVYTEAKPASAIGAKPARRPPRCSRSGASAARAAWAR